MFPKPDYALAVVKKLPSDFASVQPTKQMIKSVERYGIIHPIILRRVGKQLLLVDGRRRLLCARKLNLQFIPTRIFSDEWSVDAIVSLLLNEQRAANPLAELQSIEVLLAKDLSVNEICLETGLSLQKIKSLLRLQNLIEPIREAFNDGRIKVSTAYSLAKMKENQQRKLLPVLKENDCIKQKDVLDLKRVKKLETVAKLPASLFGGIEGEWKGLVLPKLEEIKKLANGKAPDRFIKFVERSMEMCR
jgi:ParB family chromosome partitioning protein